jgi:hypothetical protein
MNWSPASGVRSPVVVVYPYRTVYYMKFKAIIPLTLLLAFFTTGCTVTSLSPVTSPAHTQTGTKITATHPIAAIPTIIHTPDPTKELLICGDHPCPGEPWFYEGHFLLQNPIPPDANQQVDGTYRFGTTQQGLRAIHHGVEFTNPSGTPVLAAADGKVVYAGDDALVILGLNRNFYGNVIVIEHHPEGLGETLFTLYAHLSDIAVINGDAVVTGQMIGRVGLSGSAGGSHLHFEVRLGENTYDTAVNPELWLTLTPDPAGPTFGALAGWIQNAEHESMRVTNIRLEYSREEGGIVEDVVILPTYFDNRVNQDPGYLENFAISTLDQGWYRIAFIAGGKYYSKWVQVTSGMLTYQTITFE